MADLSTLLHPRRGLAESEVDAVVAGLRANVTAEAAVALGDRLRDAEQFWRFFVKRDEMNAEVHLLEGAAGPNVRWSPITIASERAAGYLARLYYGRAVEYRTALPDAGAVGGEVEAFLANREEALAIVRELAKDSPGEHGSIAATAELVARAGRLVAVLDAP